MECENLFDRRIMLYRGESMCLDWKRSAFEGITAPSAVVLEDRIALPTDLLCYEKPAGFCTTEYLGYVK